MLRIYFISCLIVCLGGAVLAQELEVPHEPGEIIITYERENASKKSVQGKAILVEHESFVHAIQEKLDIPILDQRPVYRSYVDRMVKENMSETQLQSLIQQRHASRKGISLDKVEVSSYRFSQSLTLQVAEEELLTVFEQLSHQKGQSTLNGYKVVDVSLNKQYKLAAEPNDPLFSSQYAHALTGAAAAWDVERGNGEVIIGVIDSGIDPNHEDLVGNLLPGRDFVDRNNLQAWQRIAGEDYFTPDSDPSDFDGHGTHVSGVVAAKNDNGRGLSGVCPECKILPIRAFAAWLDVEDEDEDENGNGRRDTVERSTTNIVEASEALIYAVEQGADIVNMSFAGEGRWGRTFENAMAFAQDNGVLMIASASNENTSERYYPAAYDEIMSVASTNENDRKSSFSNYGTWVDVSAPGSNILSTVPTNGRFPAEALTSLRIDERELEAFPMSFTGLTPNGPLEASLSFVGQATATDVNNPAYDWDLEGKIALIERGEITFKEKVDRVKSFGAIGAIIFNNEAGNFGGTLQEEQNDPIPAVSISQSEGRGILDQLNTSSREILANLRLEALFGYGRLDGTSFSAPYVSGMAGLILANNPALSVEEVKTKILESVDNIDAQNPQFVGQLGTGRVSLAKLFPAVVTDTQDQLAEGNLQVFPNPLERILVVEVPSGVQLNSLRVINPMGQEMRYLPQEEIQGRQRISLDLSELPMGYYIVQGEADNGRWHARVLKGE